MGKNHDHNHCHHPQDKHDHSNVHSLHHSHSSVSGNILVAFYLNFGFALIEVIGGYMTKSLAIQADALHDFGDSLSLLIIWYLQKLSNKPVSKEYSFGFSRMSILGALGVGVVLVTGSIYVLSQSFVKILNPNEVIAEGMIALAILGVVVNAWAFLRIRNAKSLSERMVSLHMLEDLWGWVIVFIGAVLIKWKSWYWVDPLLSIFVAFFILRNTYRNLKDVFRILLQGVAKNFSMDRVTEVVKKNGYIESIHHVHVWALNEAFHIVTAHLVVKENMSINEIQKIKEDISKELNSLLGPCESTFEFETIASVCEDDHHKV
jgi:cobalt-zinc-cadmium efflux system protein